MEKYLEALKALENLAKTEEQRIALVKLIRTIDSSNDNKHHIRFKGTGDIVFHVDRYAVVVDDHEYKVFSIKDARPHYHHDNLYFGVRDGE